MNTITFKDVLKVKVLYRGGEGVIGFKTPRANELIKAEASGIKKDDKDYPILDEVVLFEGFTGADGAPITIEQLKSRSIPMEIVFLVSGARDAVYQKFLSKEASEKKFEVLD